MIHFCDNSPTLNRSFQGVLVANKIDLKERRLISSEDGKQLAKTTGLEYFETSAVSF